MKFNLRLLYLYLFSFVGLIISVIGAISILDLTLKTYVFRVEESYYYPEPVMEGKSEISRDQQLEYQRKESANQNKRQLSNSLAMILVGTPLYLYHWQTIKKEQKKK